MCFAVFFNDPLAHGIELVEAATAAQALLQAELDYQGGRLGVVPAERLEACDQHRLLMGWIALEGVQEGRDGLPGSLPCLRPCLPVNDLPLRPASLPSATSG
jgi:hypothetical protein